MHSQREFLVVVTGRGDRSPLRPVIKALGDAGGRVRILDVEWDSIHNAAHGADSYMRDHDGWVIILGDRFEALTCANVATYYRLPIAHIHGGEKTEGSFDDQIRNAISMLASLHFVAAGPYWRRLVCELGRPGNHVHIVGAPGLDNLVDLPPRDPGRHFVVTYHPETAGVTNAAPLVEALSRYPDRAIFWTEPNNDPGRSAIVHVIGDKLPLTPDGYIGLCRNAAAVIGNSSSGIIEAPTIGVPTVNIGTRQKGRLMGPSIFSCRNETAEIVNAIDRALSYDGPFINPYGEPGASAKIAEILMEGDAWH